LLTTAHLPRLLLTTPHANSKPTGNASHNPMGWTQKVLATNQAMPGFFGGG